MLEIFVFQALLIIFKTAAQIFKGAAALQLQWTSRHRPWMCERERERSVYLHQIFSINYRLKHKKRTIILHFEIKTN